MAIKGTIPKTKAEQAAAFSALRDLEDVVGDTGALSLVTTPNATDEATAITLVNALKTKVNAIITALKG